jgi:hypothetical protein
MNKLVLIVSTNALLVGGLLILAGVYGAARWYFNVELGWLPWVIAAFLAAIVNTWILRHQSDSKQKEK